MYLIQSYSKILHVFLRSANQGAVKLEEIF